MNQIRNFDVYVARSLGSNQFVSSGLTLVAQACLIVYIIQGTQYITPNMARILNNSFFKTAVLSIILMSSRLSPSIAILLAIAFVVSLNKISKNTYWEMMGNEVGGIEGAVESATASVVAQSENTPVVDSVAQSNNTITIAPVVQTVDGVSTVINPSVVIAPAIVESRDGTVVTVSPVVKTLSVSENETASTNAPVDFPTTPRDTSDTGNCYPTRSFDPATVSGYSKD